MGSKGNSDFEEILISSNTEKVVRKSTIPILVVQKNNENIEFKNIVLLRVLKTRTKKMC
jgi:hypothetical protein